MNRAVRSLAVAALERPTTAEELDALAELAREVLGPRRLKRAVAIARAEKRAKTIVAIDQYGIAKRAAWERAGGQCEYDESPGQRCPCMGQDSDHAVGGAHRKECERLGAEGLIVACRQHHELKHANTPTRAYWLGQAKAHALRQGMRGLLAIVERAIARNEMTHPEAT